MEHSLKAVIAELTHRCPLHCVYCSNPIEMQARSSELTTADWLRIYQQAAELGALQVHFTGGEPLARHDLVELVAAARESGLYVDLITSGLGLTPAKLDALLGAGLDHVQLSFQGADEASANEIAGARSHAIKLQISELIRSRRVAFTVNMVVHRRNLDQLDGMISMAEASGAQRLEIAHVQYYGWALKNRAELLPTRTQLEASIKTVEAAKQRLAGKLKIDFVLPDYYAKYPKPCMNGWGRQQMIVDPIGRALPCHSAGILPGIRLSNVREAPLRWIWEESESFNRYRGSEWLPAPCRSCERATRDFGGCRCQAFLLTGSAEVTDPVCTLAPERALVEEILDASNALLASKEGTEPLLSPEWVYRIESA